ncbi:FadR/GntR family transcriptional regulator [Pseudorhodoferax sp. Leaf267]|uniref:FadR/GntR family transcriptional regulator n=1 Tax=Pseudorhodoferax sp. Leaf267 TaxID=1736316 RepID=UPI0012E1CD75|nr:GntR family transcriptional regulator [Pseudorhodoferax sp. Leaf267]
MRTVDADDGTPSRRPRADASMFQRLRLEPAYKVVSSEIERSILDGQLQPGMPLPTEQSLAERFGVHRSTVREAIRQIEQEGLVQRREGRRLFVALPGLYEMAPRAARLLLLQQTTFAELWQVAVTLEPLAAQLAALNAEPLDLQELAANTERTADLQAQGAESVEDNARLVELDVEFHALVGRASHNRALMLAREPISLLYNPTLLQIHLRLPQSKARNLAAHRAILDALQRRDAAAAAEWTRKHMVDFQKGFEMTGLDMQTPIARARSS